MKILLLGPERTELETWLTEYGDTVIWTDERLDAASDLVQSANWLISYGYRHILKPDILMHFQNRVINLHISMLPWNRGADPNLWSFLEDTPKGVSIHLIDAGIDTGGILAQREVDFDMETATLRSSYDRLTNEMLNLFKVSWPAIRNGDSTGHPQTSEGTYHRLRDKDPYQHLLFNGWDTPVKHLIGKAMECTKKEM